MALSLAPEVIFSGYGFKITNTILATVLVDAILVSLVFFDLDLLIYCFILKYYVLIANYI